MVAAIKQHNRKKEGTASPTKTLHKQRSVRVAVAQLQQGTEKRLQTHDDGTTSA
jgi:hypothetical protein